MSFIKFTLLIRFTEVSVWICWAWMGTLRPHWAQDTPSDFT